MLAASLLIEQNDDWLVGRRYLSEGSMALVLAGRPEPEGAPVPRGPARPGRAVGALGGDLRAARGRAGVVHPPDRAVRRARCGALACGSVASVARRGTSGRVPV